jgi:dolichyl-phosphate-mannose-protein mannosyltransferase
MGKSNGARGRSPQPPSEKQQQPAAAAQLQPALAVPGAPKARSKSRSKSRSKNKKKAVNAISTSYKSDGVEDNDVFLLPVSDYVVALGIIALATLVRTWKIYMPTSVVFDEVQ